MKLDIYNLTILGLISFLKFKIAGFGKTGGRRAYAFSERIFVFLYDI